MRSSKVFSFLTLLTCLACESSDRGQVTGSNPSFDAVPDLEGTPDLIVDSHMLAASWVVYEETFASNGCTAIEGGFKGGTYLTMRFSVSTPNIGDADIAIGDPNRHIDPNGDGDFSDSDGLYEFAPCHNHYHFRNYARYEIFPMQSNGSLGAPIQARKMGFCMIDTTPWRENDAPRAANYRSCGAPGIPGNQGVSTGWADQYFKWLSGQFFLLNDPTRPIPPGDYVIRITVNPPFTAGAGEPCPFVDASGKCRMFEESNYNNNVGEARVQVPARVGRTGFGPGGGQAKQEETMVKQAIKEDKVK
jgi:hypothetical protein